MADTLTYAVPGMSCGHCEAAVREELIAVEGVGAVEVDLETKLVTVVGDALNDQRLRIAIADAGYEAV